MAFFSFYINNAKAQTKRKTAFSTTGKKLMVYTTADNTSMRLSAAEGAAFKPMPQPLETQVGASV